MKYEIMKCFAHVVGKYCNIEKPDVITSTGNALSMRFISNARRHGGGFHVQYRRHTTGKKLLRHLIRLLVRKTVTRNEIAALSKALCNQLISFLAVSYILVLLVKVKNGFSFHRLSKSTRHGRWSYRKL